MPLWGILASPIPSPPKLLPDCLRKLLGHRQVQTTARYAHLGRNSVKTAAAKIADSLEADMDTPPDVSLAA